MKLRCLCYSFRQKTRSFLEPAGGSKIRDISEVPINSFVGRPVIVVMIHSTIVNAMYSANLTSITYESGPATESGHMLWKCSCQIHCTAGIFLSRMIWVVDPFSIQISMAMKALYTKYW